jgi:hypothetical protein
MQWKKELVNNGLLLAPKNSENSSLLQNISSPMLPKLPISPEPPDTPTVVI